MKIKGFTLIELLVVVAIIGILATVVLASLGSARSRARDAKRIADMTNIRTALELYFLDNNSYPSTGSLNTVYMDTTCLGPAATSPDIKNSNWIPNLVSGGYMGSLPQNLGEAGYDYARSLASRNTCYMYASDGNFYILSAWGVVENGPISTTHSLYSRVGFREGNYGDHLYYCNHPNIGNTISGDYYRYSYTLTNITTCTW